MAAAPTRWKVQHRANVFYAKASETPLHPQAEQFSVWVHGTRGMAIRGNEAASCRCPLQLLSLRPSRCLTLEDDAHMKTAT